MNTNNKKTFTFLVVSVLLITLGVSCNRNTIEQSDILAKTDSQVLLKSEVVSVMPKGLVGEDSVAFVKQYVDNWLHFTLLYEKAADNITDSDSSIAKQVDLFRKDLFINKYEQLFLQQKLDTLIPQKDINAYYSKHKGEFLLDEDVVKPIVIVFPVSQKEHISYIEKKFFSKSKNDDVLDALKDYCFQHCQQFSFGDEWVSLQALKQELPLDNRSTKFTIGKGVEISDSDNVYFVKITEQLNEGTTMPVELAHDKIAKILLQTRKIELLKTMRNKVYQDATHKKQYKVYYE